MRSPLFVFPSRQFSQPHLRHEERLSFSFDCRAAEMVGRDDPIAPPTRNENEPDSLPVKQQQGTEKTMTEEDKTTIAAAAAAAKAKAKEIVSKENIDKAKDGVENGVELLKIVEDC